LKHDPKDRREEKVREERKMGAFEDEKGRLRAHYTPFKTKDLTNRCMPKKSVRRRETWVSVPAVGRKKEKEKHQKNPKQKEKGKLPVTGKGWLA